MAEIVITLGRTDPGGVEVRTLELLQHLKVRNAVAMDAISVYVVSGESGALEDSYRALGVRLIHGRPGLKGLLHFASVLSDLRPRVLHVNASYASGVYCLVGFLLRIPVRCAHLRSAALPEMSGWRKLKYALYLPLLWLFSTRILGVTKAAKHTAMAPGRKWRLLYDGFPDPDAEMSKPPVPPFPPGSSRIIGIVGRMHACKNLPFAARVLNELGETVPVEAWFIGKEDPDIKREIEDTVSRGSNTICRYFGQLPHREAMELLQSCDVLLLTSIREGLPGVCIEALARGVPVVASDLPGVIEIAQHMPRLDFLSLDAGPEAWASCVAKVLSQPRLTRSEADRAFKASPFSVESHARALLEEWQLE